MCRECKLQQAHICLHSYAPSKRSSVSAGSLRRAGVAGLPGAEPRLKFNSRQLMFPRVYKEMKDIAPAGPMSEVPRTTKRVLRKVESLSALIKFDETSLPADVPQAIFRALYLSIEEEKKTILHYLEADVGVTVTVIR